MNPRRLALFSTAVALTVWGAASWRSAASAQGLLDRRADDGVAGIGSITWGTCDDDTLVEFGAECGFLSVPLDYSRPTGAKVTLALSRLRHTVPDDQYQGIMLANPGGPGAAPRAFLRDFPDFAFPAGLRERFDIVALDPRGVGDSKPSIACEKPTVDAKGTQYPRTREEFDQLAAYNRSVTEGCRRATGPLIDHVDTVSVARDFDEVRTALGERQVSWLGLSYGTLLGATYVNLDEPAEGCDLDFVTGSARQLELGTVLVVARGYGGFNAALVLRREV